MRDPSLPSEGQVRIAIGISTLIILGFIGVNAMVLTLGVRDLAPIYAAARMVSEGDGARLYDLPEQTRFQAELFHGERGLAFIQPPFEVWLFVPFSRLPYQTVYLIWAGINTLLWMFCLYLLRPHVPRPRHPLQYLLLGFVFYPLWAALLQGQTSILVMVFLALAYLCLKRRREVWAGGFVALGLIKFAIAVPLALILLLRGKWRVVAGFAAVASVLGLVSVLTVGPAGMAAYARLLFETSKHSAFRPSGIEVAEMPSLRGLFGALFARVLPGPAVNALVLVASLLLIGYVAWRWRRTGDDEGPRLDVMFAAALLISMATSFHLLIHDLSLALIAVLLIVGSAQYPAGSTPGMARTIAVGAMYWVFLWPTLFGLNRLYLFAPVLVLLAWAGMKSTAARGQEL